MTSPVTPPAPPATGAVLLRRAVRRRLRLVVPGLAFMVLWQVCEAVVPISIGLIIDHAVLPLDPTLFVIMIVGLGLLFFVLSWAYRLGARRNNKALHLETHDLRVEVAAHALHPRGTRTPLRTGEILSVATADADVAGTIFRHLALGGSAAVGIVFTAGYLLITDWLTGLAVLVGVPAGLLLVRMVSPLLSRRTHVQQQAIGLASAMASDLLRGLRVIKGIGGETTALARYRDTSQRAMRASVDTADGIGRMEGLGGLATCLVLGTVTALAGWRVTTGDLTVGQLVSVIGVATFLAEPVGTVGVFMAMVSRSRAAAERITDFLNTPPLLVDGPQTPAPDAPRTVTIDGVDVTPGECVALAVDDPATARAIATALAGEATSTWLDRVRYAGLPRSEVAADGARDLVVVPHDSDLFEGTLASNIGLATDDPRLDAVLEASATAELLDLFPDGLGHPIHAAGSNLSGGQRQRISLARALAAGPPTLVLHDPTTAVDAVTELAIAAGVRRVRGRDRTTIMITSSPALCSAADRVVHLDGTSAPVTGVHEELMARSDRYREAVAR